MYKRSHVIGSIAVLMISFLVFMGCPTDAGTDDNGESPGSETVTGGGGGGGGGSPSQETFTEVTAQYPIKWETDSEKMLTSGGLAVESVLKDSKGNLTITVTGTATTGIPIGAVEKDYFRVESFNITEASKLSYAVITFDGFHGGDGTRITQINNSFILFKDMPGYNRDNGPNVPIWVGADGTHSKTKTYASLDDPFDLTLLIAEGKGPITLEITPAGVDTDKYTVEVDYRKVKFNDEAVVAAKDIPAAKKPILPESPSKTSYPAGLEIASITQGKSTGIYTVSLSSDDPVGDTSVSDLEGSLSDDVVGDFAAEDRWEGDLLEEGVTIATLDLKLDGYASGLTIKQENPGFELYEEYFKDGSGGAWDGSKFCYAADQSLIWSGQNGRILYKQKTYANEAEYGKTDFGGLDFILWGGAKEKVVTFTITYTNSDSVEVTKIIKVDYNDVKFIE